MSRVIQNSTSTFTIFPGGGGFTRPQYLTLARHGICTEYAPGRFHAIVMRVRSHHSSSSSPASHSSHATALLFSSGRVVMTGVRVQRSSQIRRALHCAAHRVCRRVRASLCAGGLSRLASTVAVRRLTLRNLVTVVQAPHRVSLERLADQLRLWQQQRHHHHRSATSRMEEPLLSGTRICQVTFCMLDACSFPGLRCTLTLQQHTANNDDGNGDANATFLLFRTGRIIITGVRSVRMLQLASESIQTLATEYSI